jgi:uncharacterized protein involved in outer membrane biogenesis
MRHWGIAAGVALGAALGLSLGTTSWSIDPARVARDLDGGVGALQAPEAASLRLLPRPTLTLKGVRLDAAGGVAQVRAAGAEVALRFAPLLSGAFAPLSLTLTDAEMNVDLDAAQRAAAALTDPPVVRLVVIGGVLDLASARRDWRTRLEIASARLDWPSAGSALRAAATGRWRAQPVEATLELGAPAAAAHGDSSSVRASIDAPLAQMRLAGDWSPGGTLDGAQYRGQASALIPSLERFARWLGVKPPPGPRQLELSGRLTAEAAQARLSDASLTLGGQPFEGDLALVRAAQGWSVSGTLAAETLDLEPLLGAPPALSDADGGWSKTPALPAPMEGLDLDLRVSATRASWRGQAIDNAAAAVSQRAGRFGVKLLDAGFAQGSLSGEMSIEDKAGQCETRLSLSLDNADLGALLSSFGERHFTGQGGLKLSLRARGRSPAEIVATADGEASLEIADGGLDNINFEEALRRGQRRLIDVARDMNAGSTRFGAAKGRAEISNGAARFVDTSTHAPGVTLSLDGAADLVGRAWRAHLTARQAAADGTPTPDGARLDFGLYGPWSGPVLAPVSPPAD